MKISVSVFEEFEKFLVEEDAFSQYCINLQEQAHISFNEFPKYLEEVTFYAHTPYGIITTLVAIPFSWWSTNQGYEYWEKISNKWMERSKNFLNNS